MKITQRKLHIGAAIAVVLYSVIYTAFVAHGNVAATFFIIGLWVLSSFSDRTRWLFYAFLIVQAWANWHVIGIGIASAFVAYCVLQNLAYRKAHPAPPDTTFTGKGAHFDRKTRDFLDDLDRLADEKDRNAAEQENTRQQLEEFKRQEENY